MDAKERLLRNEIGDIIDVYNIADYEVQGYIINDLFKKFYIIPKEKATTSIGIDGRTVITIEPWDLEPIPNTKNNPLIMGGVLVVSECCRGIEGVRWVKTEDGVGRYYCNRCGKEIYTMIFPKEEK